MGNIGFSFQIIDQHFYYISESDRRTGSILYKRKTSPQIDVRTPYSHPYAILTQGVSGEKQLKP